MGASGSKDSQGHTGSSNDKRTKHGRGNKSTSTGAVRTAPETGAASATGTDTDTGGGSGTGITGVRAAASQGTGGGLDLAKLFEKDHSRMYFHLDPEGIIKYVSGGCARLVGYSQDELTNKSTYDFIHQEDRHIVQDRFQQSKREPHATIELKYRRIHKNGVVSMMKFCGHWVCEYDSPAGIMGWEQDARRGKDEHDELTEEGATSGENIAAENGKIMTFALHELRNAIHALDASASYIGELTSDTVDDEMKESVSDMMFAAKNTNVLVGDILSVIGLRDGTVAASAEDFPIRSYVKDLTSSMAPLSTLPIIPVVSPSVPLVVCADWDNISHILRNGLITAIKFSAESSREPIYVSVSKRHSHLVFEVRDSGTPLVNVSKDELMTALTKGTHIRGARAQRMSLFLPIADSVVSKLMFGEVGIDSKQHLTRFWFTAKYSSTTDSKRMMMAVQEDEEYSLVQQSLPNAHLSQSDHSPKKHLQTPADRFLADTINPEGSTTPTSSTGSETRKGREKKVLGIEGDGKPLNMHVLLVDDQKVVRRQASSFLDQLGCTYKLLDDGDQVDEALSQTYRPFDAIILDILMHRSDGAKVCEKLRKSKDVKGPIIAMTSQTESRDVQRYYSMGFDVVLSKPFTRESLGKSLLEGQQRRGIFTKFTRMSARYEDESTSKHTTVATQGSTGSGGGAVSSTPGGNNILSDSTRPPASSLQVPGSTESNEALMPLGLPPRRQKFH